VGCSSQYRGVRSIRRLQLFVKTLCHHCPDDPSACPYVNSHLPGETLRQLEHSNFQTFSNVIFFICFVTCFILICTVTFPTGVIQ